jgi:hypothetical protein
MKTCPVTVDEFRDWVHLPASGSPPTDPALDTRISKLLISASESIENKTDLVLVTDDEASPPVSALSVDIPELVLTAIKVRAAGWYDFPVADDAVDKATELTVERLISPYRVYKYPASS